MKNRRFIIMLAIIAAIASVPVPLGAESDEGPKRTRFTDWGRDPFSRFSSAGGLRFTGILSEKGKYRAIVNDIVVKEGDKVESYTVIRIRKDRIIINNGIKDTELKLTK